MMKLSKLGMTTVICIFLFISCKSVQTTTNINQNTSNIVEKRWKLIELNGKELKTEGQTPEIFFILNNKDNRVTGNGGCNSFSGSYTLSEGNRISFSALVSTMMACMNMEIETQFYKVLEAVDNYTVKDNILSLNKARMAPLAKFALSEKQ